ncbi:hypothetical protein CKAH01_18057 [Colletotrichum kahawae]|uniref:Uncharacterized protein n=1 Tax=Colletotrichum kahawae TaxID=34407 RepID=A0AAD9Y9N4_COLKA|nr:hypothetical protein CKAH01_18057 [Colletotrichum kahawae]
MHSSWFEYPITRPYPFRWFTPTAIVGGLILAVVFTLVNFRSNGFYLKTIYTKSLNDTEASFHSRWFQKRPFNWQNDMNAECQPHLLTVGSSFFTSNLGFNYKVKSIKPRQTDTERLVSRLTNLPAIGYRNTTLEDCHLDTLEINLIKSDNAQPPSWWLSWGRSTVAASLRCVVISDSGLVDVTIDAEYSGESDVIYDYVLDDDYETRSSVWWGSRLSNAYFGGVLTATSQVVVEDDQYLTSVQLSFTANRTTKDIRSNSFFQLQWWLAFSKAQILHSGMQDLGDTGYDSDFFVAAPFAEGLHYARLMNSLFAMDLGNCNASNLLLDEDGLQYAIIAPDNKFRRVGGLLNNSATMGGLNPSRFNEIPAPGAILGGGGDIGLTRLNETYAKFRSKTGPLLCKDATIMAEYLCSVPQQKSPGVMFLAILLADLVFLQAAWKLFQLAAGSAATRGSPDAMVCRGCLTTRLGDSNILEMVPLRSEAGDPDVQSSLKSRSPYTKLSDTDLPADHMGR